MFIKLQLFQMKLATTTSEEVVEFLSGVWLWIYENTIEPDMSHTSAHTFLDNIFQNSKSHVFMNVEIFGKRESTCHQKHTGAWGNSHFQAQVRSSNSMNTSLIMNVRKPARKQELPCTRRLR